MIRDNGRVVRQTAGARVLGRGANGRDLGLVISDLLNLVRGTSNAVRDGVDLATLRGNL